MWRNLVMCSDGTGNTFDSRVTNVTGLVKCLELDDPERQLVFYDQGVGTTALRGQEINRVAQAPGGEKALRILEAPIEERARTLAWVNRGRGLLFGYGLKANLRQMYRELAQEYDSANDRLFLFGFSRGAFTVRALAGLLHRCYLPHPDSPDNIDERFERSWRLFQPMDGDAAAIDDLRREHRPCPVHFLGMWDTVKSYGGLNPVILPHLRHNPDVAHVRHALALDERRAWFKPTTWGQLDSDREAAMTRVDPDDAAAYQSQDIGEVWFTGCHSDVGGGDQGAATARIALRWMLGEAAHVTPRLMLNHAGSSLLRESDPPSPPRIHQSWTRTWRITEQIPRSEIDNSGVYPRKVLHRGSDGLRDPYQAQRAGTVTVHASARGLPPIQGRVDICETKGPPPDST